MHLQHLKFLIFLWCVAMTGTMSFAATSPPLDISQAEIKTSSGGLVSRFAPGELVPLSVELSNFGGTRRADVTITYRILDENGAEVLSDSATVAVETTASFVKIIQLPQNIAPGRYTAISNITYAFQEVPAVSSFQFTVERKIAGIFVSQFLLFGGVTVGVGFAFAVVGRLILKRRRSTRFSPYDYANVSKEQRMYYELISDTIMQMRTRVGDVALEIAGKIDDLAIDKDSGRVLKLKESPAKIMALLILYYEKYLGKKMSFSLREQEKPDMQTKDYLAGIDKNLFVVRKYFM